jgi:hypothetical protein
MKTTGGMMAAAAGGSQPSRHLFKGDKMKVDRETMATIIDFGAQAITHINHAQKTYTVTPFSEIGAKLDRAAMDVSIDVRETGQRKVIGGYNCREVVLTMDTEAQQAPSRPGAGMKMRITMDLWISPDVPGYQELHAIYKRIAAGPGWAAMMGGAGNQGMMKAMADLQKKMADLGGVPVLQTIKMGAAGDSPQAAQAQQQMAEARQRLEAMKAQGGAQAKAAEAMLARMGGSGGSFMEITTESSGFSTAAIPASEFAPPAGYQKK